jgi:pSer/pThr/pTyr-binding forkhead associated (FHA) protein
LRFGEFGVTAKLTGGDGPREKGAPEDTSGQTRIFRTEKTGGNVQGEDQGTSAISAEEARRHGLARETVELVMEDGSYPLEGQGPWSIGRSEENDIVIQDPNVSRRHARLLRSENGFIVEDLDSTNGTLLDGAPIGHERIENGDELTFGSITARFVRRMENQSPSSRQGRDFGASAPRKKGLGGR